MSTGDPGAATMASKLCDECDGEGTQVCAVCHSSRYCSKACQKLAWPSHKPLCKTFKSLPPRPAAKGALSYTRAILFDPVKKFPQFVWLAMEWHEPEDEWESAYISPRKASLQKYLDPRTLAKWGDVSVFSAGGYFTRNELMGRQLNYTIEIGWRDTFMVDGSDQNAAINSITDKTSPYLHEWRGPVIAYGTDFKDNACCDAKAAVDLTPSDLRHIADYFNGYLFNRYTNDPALLTREFKNKRMARKAASKGHPKKVVEDLVDAVRINCYSDVLVNGRPKYEPVQIPAGHPIFQQPPTPVSERIEFPIAAARIPGSIDSCDNTSNPQATYLYRGCDPNLSSEDCFRGGYSWGMAPLLWDNPVGSCLVARLDKKPLLLEHAEALAEYCWEHLGEVFGKQMMGEYGDPRIGSGRSQVLNEISKDKFEAYFQGWKARQTDPEKRQAKSPYPMSPESTSIFWLVIWLTVPVVLFCFFVSLPLILAWALYKAFRFIIF